LRGEKLKKGGEGSRCHPVLQRRLQERREREKGGRGGVFLLLLKKEKRRCVGGRERKERGAALSHFPFLGKKGVGNEVQKEGGIALLLPTLWRGGKEQKGVANRLLSLRKRKKKVKRGKGGGTVSSV